MSEKTLKSRLAGSWYPADPVTLAEEIDGYLDRAGGSAEPSTIGLLLPHAGYRYSGAVAAHAVVAVRGRTFDRVIVLGPSHHVAMPGRISLPDVDAVETPLGRIETDRKVMERLWTHPRFASVPEAHLEEHAVQIELPFLQRALSGSFALVPAVCGALDRAGVREAAEALKPFFDDRTLLVVSSDFTHYGRAFGYVPFRDAVSEKLRELDLGAFAFVEAKDARGFLDCVDRTGATICGRVPIAIALEALPEDACVRLAAYGRSAESTGDWSHCVSYVAATFERGKGSRASGSSLTPEEKRALLGLARHVIEARLRGASAPAYSFASSSGTSRKMGAFVTLHEDGALRGCIGEILPQRALWKAVRERAADAAFHDPRFPPLREEELERIDIEISALTPPRSVESWREIEIGRHGIVLSKRGRSAVFLPQVAPEQGWGLEETLRHLAFKAGLGPEDWREGCAFRVFEAIVFGERDG